MRYVFILSFFLWSSVFGQERGVGSPTQEKSLDEVIDGIDSLLKEVERNSQSAPSQSIKPNPFLTPSAPVFEPV